MSIETIKAQAGYCDTVYKACCGNCDYCVQLKRNYKCLRHGFIVSKTAVCREGFTERPADSMMQRLYGGAKGANGAEQNPGGEE